MSKYTVSIKELIENGNIIFDFDFDFYDDSISVKNNFINKFIDHYLYYEIAFEDVDMFKHFLKGKLNLNAPYWKQLYQTELKCKDIDFMLNKDLKETFTRELTNNENNERVTNGTSEENNERVTSGTSNDTSNIDVTLTDKYLENSSGKNKNSSIDNGLSSVDLTSGYLTSVNDSTNSNQYNLEEHNTGTNSNETESNFTNTENKQGNINEKTEFSSEGNINEKTEFISQGNIGVTSSAELLEKWRKVLINLDLMIIQELNSLFLKIY